ncbi:hypothetical protein V6N12_034833 [Hibiscus sabdariffa]|uniref:F-box associated domain-containing protein n=1 Tax=Hibiscus sabdariffa TaxID=183260 RepID=A0ABR2BNK0_9ROSI
MGEVPYKIDVVFSQSAYVNGAIYWFTDEFYHLNQDEVILMFDLHNDKFQAIPHPKVRQVEEEDFPLWLLQTSPAPAAAATETMLNDNLRKISGPRRRRSNGGRWVVYIVCS